MFHNPVRWSFHGEAGLLRLAVKGADPDSSPSPLVYRIPAAAPAFDFGGYRIALADSLQDWQYAHARTGCPELLPRRRTAVAPAPN